MAHMCTACHVVPRDNLVWFLARSSSPRFTRKSSGTNIHCAFCDSQSKAKDKFCVVSMQCGNSVDSSHVDWAEPLLPLSRTLQ